MDLDGYHGYPHIISHYHSRILNSRITCPTAGQQPFLAHIINLSKLQDHFSVSFDCFQLEFKIIRVVSLVLTAPRKQYIYEIKYVQISQCMRMTTFDYFDHLGSKFFPIDHIILERPLFNCKEMSVSCNFLAVALPGLTKHSPSQNPVNFRACYPIIEKKYRIASIVQ